MMSMHKNRSKYFYDRVSSHFIHESMLLGKCKLNASNYVHFGFTHLLHDIMFHQQSPEGNDAGRFLVLGKHIHTELLLCKSVIFKERFFFYLLPKVDSFCVPELPQAKSNYQPMNQPSNDNNTRIRLPFDLCSIFCVCKSFLPLGILFHRKIV